MKTTTKRKEHAFGKDIYLLGTNQEGEKVWLEAPTWDCNWYWGFGYLETYTNNNDPQFAKDISSHLHFDSTIGKQENGKHAHHLHDLEWQECTLSESESWKLSDLMKQFYVLKDAAAIFRSGNAHISGGGDCGTKDLQLENHINKILLPVIFKEIEKILNPTT